MKNVSKKTIIKGEYYFVMKSNVLLVLNSQIGKIEESIARTPVDKEGKRTFTLTFEEGFIFRCIMNDKTNTLTIIIEGLK